MLTNTDKQYILSIPADVEMESLESFYATLDGISLNENHSVVIDCSRLINISTRHIVIIWQAFNYCKEAGAKVKLASVNFELSQTLKLLDIYDLFIIGSESDFRKKSTSSASAKMMQHSFSLKIKPIREDIGKALLEFQRFLDGWRLADLLAFELATVFYEVATNIRLHANLDSDSLIEFRAELDEDRIKMWFIDSGIPFDPTAVDKNYNPADVIKSRKKRGLGLTLISRIVDTQVYCRIDNKANNLKLEKSIKIKDNKYD